MGDTGHAETGSSGPCSPQKRVAEAGPSYVLVPRRHVLPLKDTVALKNADQLLDDVMKAVDTDGNGNISYDGQPAQRKS